MASTIITKNSSTASATPAVGDLQQGELAVNVTDKKVYTKDSSAAIVKLVGSLGNQEASAVAITGGSIAGITDLAVADGGTGSSTAAGARSNLSAAASGANSDITSLSGLTTALSVAQGGTGVTSSTGSGSVVLSNSPTLVTPALGTPSAAVLTNATGLPLSTGISGLGTGVATFLGTPSSANLLAAVTDETGTGALVFANSPTLVTPALGTPASATLTNATGLPIGTGVSGLGTGVATALAVNVGSAGAPVVNGGVLGTPSSGTLTNATGLPISTGVSGLGTGVATALAVNVGSAGAPVVNGGALGTPSSGTVTNLTGTASININGTVGATTPTTGAFTTLTTSSTVTLNGGTANGLAYLNASKVLTSGSALTFDGTTLGNSTSGTPLSLNRTGAGTALIELKQSGTIGSYLGTSGASDFIIFNGSAAELARFNGTGLGIGTSSPAYKLDVNGAIRASGDGSSVGFYLSASAFRQNATGGLYIDANASGSAGGIYFRDSSSFTTRMSIDSAGNLGLGVTPSAWQSTTIRPIEINRTGNFVGGNGSAAAVYLGANARFESSSWRYANNGAAGLYTVEDNTHFWRIAGSGTAGNAITFTQAMTLDADGRLAIGTTTPLKFNTSGSSSARLLTVFNSGTNSGTRGELQIGNASTTSGDTTGLIMFGCGASTTTANQTAIIYSELTASSTSVAYGALVFGTANGAGAIERARIDSSGNLLVGTTSLPALNRVKGFAAQSGSSGGIQIYQTANVSDWAVTSTSGSIVNFYSDTGSALTYAGSISVNGNVTTYGSVSDYRLKENVQPMQGALTKVLQLNPVTFAFKDSGQISQGFIAHELAEVVPDAVTGEKDAVDENGNPKYQGIDTSFLVATLTAALQELNAKFDAYVASHP